MRLLELVGIAALGVFAGCAVPASAVVTYETASATEGPSTIFYNALAQHGTWVYSNDYGWVWVPSATVVGGDFQPYATNGQWLYTSAGWTFVSDWTWGWAPFHYGRWYFDDFYGWTWVPGDVWAPAWVDWRFGGGAVGWAPLGPRYRRHDRVSARRSHWVFTRVEDFLGPDVHQRLISRARASQLMRQTKPVHLRGRVDDSYYYHGPPPYELSGLAQQSYDLRDLQTQRWMDRRILERRIKLSRSGTPGTPARAHTVKRPNSGSVPGMVTDPGQPPMETSGR